MDNCKNIKAQLLSIYNKENPLYNNKNASNIFNNCNNKKMNFSNQYGNNNNSKRILKNYSFSKMNGPVKINNNLKRNNSYLIRDINKEINNNHMKRNSINQYSSKDNNDKKNIIIR